MYVADDTDSGACSNDFECFIQTLGLYINYAYIPRLVNILFSDNTALKSRVNIFGGLLDRCHPSPFAEVYLKPNIIFQIIHYSGVAYLGNISNMMPPKPIC